MNIEIILSQDNKVDVKQFPPFYFESKEEAYEFLLHHLKDPYVILDAVKVNSRVLWRRKENVVS